MDEKNVKKSRDTDTLKTNYRAKILQIHMLMTLRKICFFISVITPNIVFFKKNLALLTVLLIRVCKILFENNKI